MKVQLKELRLRNFKGVIDQTFEFGISTEIRGTNGTGKTTLFDAFTFALFGKDSNGRTDFGYKRRDKDGNVVHSLEYGVEVTLEIDGVEKRFERIVTEKCTRDVVTGHQSAFYIDRVRCATKKEYDTAVSEIATEDVMRMLTNVGFFMEQADDLKKAMLLKMAFGTESSNDADKLAAELVLEKQPIFAQFVAELNNTPLHIFNANITRKIAAIKDEINTIPTKIAAKKETVPAEEDWDGLRTLIEENEAELKEVDRQIEDDNARKNGSEAERNKLKAEISNLSLELTRAQNAVCSKAIEDESAKRRILAEADAAYTKAVNEYNGYAERKKAIEPRINELSTKLGEMREQYKSIFSDTYEYSENELVCPTCHRPYELAGIKEAKLRENKNLGLAIKKELDQLTAEAAVLDKNMAECRAGIDAAYKHKEESAFVPADVSALCKSDPKCQELKEKIAAKNKEIDELPVMPTDTQLQKKRDEIAGKITMLQQKLGTQDLIVNVNKQVEALIAKQKALNEELGTLEKQQETAKEFQKAKDKELLEKVNGMFSIVSWDFVSEQLNGNDKITCNCYVNGMPYRECNHAKQVNAGLDIINAISRNENIYLPIFIDNAESVVDYVATISQIILLIVDKNCKELTIYPKK